MQLESAHNEAHTAQESHKESVDDHKEKKVMEYEAKMKEIKETIGASSIHDVLNKVEGQQVTKENLQKLRLENEKRLKEMRTNLAEVQAQFEDIKYSSAHSNKAHSTVFEQELSDHLVKAQGKCLQNKIKFEKASKLLSEVEAGIVHLNQKLDATANTVLILF